MGLGEEAEKKHETHKKITIIVVVVLIVTLYNRFKDFLPSLPFIHPCKIGRRSGTSGHRQRTEVREGGVEEGAAVLGRWWQNEAEEVRLRLRVR